MDQEQVSSLEELPPLPAVPPSEELPPLPDLSPDGELAPLPAVPPSEELPPLSDLPPVGELAPLSAVLPSEELPPLPDLPPDGELAPLPAVPPSEELPPLPPSLPVPEYASDAAAQPVATQQKKPIFWMTVFAAAAIYGAVDVWQTAQATDQALHDAQQNRVAIDTAKANTQKAHTRYKDILKYADMKKQYEDDLQRIDGEIDSVKIDMDSSAQKLESLKEKETNLRR